MLFKTQVVVSLRQVLREYDIQIRACKHLKHRSQCRGIDCDAQRCLAFLLSVFHFSRRSFSAAQARFTASPFNFFTYVSNSACRCISSVVFCCKSRVAVS